jgi:hypothetical protein
LKEYTYKFQEKTTGARRWERIRVEDQSGSPQDCTLGRYLGFETATQHCVAALRGSFFAPIPGSIVLLTISPFFHKLPLFIPRVKSTKEAAT